MLSEILYCITKHVAVSAKYIPCLLLVCRLEVQHPDRQYIEADLLQHMQVEDCRTKSAAKHIICRLCMMHDE